MSDGKLIGFRVVTPGAADTFELRQAAEQCYRLLRGAKVPAELFMVTELSGVERRKQIKPRRAPRAPT